jgi:hypothetical protein
MMIRFVAAAFGALALAGCMPAPAPAQSNADAPPAADEAFAPLDLTKGEMFTPAGGQDDDSSFRGPMRLLELPKSKDGAARYAFAWMDGKHVVTATEVGAADGAWKIDGPLTLAAALGAGAQGKIALLQVDEEDGPAPDPNYTPLCGVRVVNLIALYRDADKVALATTSRAFTDGNDGGCSNAITYTRKKD